MKVAKRGGGVAKGTRDLYEGETKMSAVSKDNMLSYQYVDEQKKNRVYWKIMNAI